MSFEFLRIDKEPPSGGQSTSRKNTHVGLSFPPSHLGSKGWCWDDWSLRCFEGYEQKKPEFLFLNDWQQVPHPTLEWGGRVVSPTGILGRVLSHCWWKSHVITCGISWKSKHWTTMLPSHAILGFQDMEFFSAPAGKTHELGWTSHEPSPCNVSD